MRDQINLRRPPFGLGSPADETPEGGEAKLTEIGIDVGFSDGNYFSRQVKRVMGLPPREYRRSL